MFTLLQEEENFYKNYQWCLDPLPAWGEMRRHFLEEMERWRAGAKGWQERESAVNCWLMGSALWQGMSDHAIRGTDTWLHLIRWLGRDSRLHRMVRTAHEQFVFLRNATVDRVLLANERAWREFLKKFSRVLVDEHPARPEHRAELSAQAARLLGVSYPARLLRTRCRLPSAFRSQDFTHYDVMTLLAQYVNDNSGNYHPKVVIGLRTTGSYLVPVAQVYLEKMGLTVLDAATIRPGECLSSSEKAVIAKGIKASAEFIIVSEPPVTGASLGAVFERLLSRGVKKSSISMLFPVYPVQMKWRCQSWMQEINGPRVYTLAWNNWHLVKELKPEKVKRLLADYYDGQDLQLIGVEESPRGKYVDARFGSPERAGWRLKQVYRVKVWDGKGREFTEDILAKSAGWGWLGYHAYIEGDRLRDFVPELIGLRSGLLFLKWAEGKSCKSQGLDAGPLLAPAVNYIVARVNRLPLPEDMTFRDYSRRYYGGLFLCSILSKAYGNRFGEVLMPLIRRLLQKYATRTPAVIDGKMGPEEWLMDGERLLKVDFEHHGFGATELNIADPVFDIASFVFEFRLTLEQRREMVRLYTEKTGDRRVEEKVLLYLWLIAHHNLQNEKNYLGEANAYRRSIEENRKYISDREYINLLSTEYFGRLVGTLFPPPSGKTYFMLNVDGVLDREIWEFPTTTMSGVRALSLLHAHGIPVFINTGRSINEVKAYCAHLGFEGGVAEFGSVLWDNRRTRMIVLVDRRTQEEIARMRSILLEFPSIYINPHYHFLIRAFHYREQSSSPLDGDRIARLLEGNGLTRLKVFTAGTETLIMAKEIDKGTGMDSLFSVAFPRPDAVVSLGFAEEDMPMLRRSHLVFVPPQLAAQTELRGKGTVRTVELYQKGLLAAARYTAKKYGLKNITVPPAAFPNELMARVLAAADRSKLGRLYSLLESIRTTE